MEFWHDALFFTWELSKFMAFFYSVWAPGFLCAALLSRRYRLTSWNRVLSNHTSRIYNLLNALALGVVGSSGRKTSTNAMHYLLDRGASPSVGITFLIASRNMTLYFWAIFALSLGAEFATGAIIGTLVMIGLAVPFLNWLELKVRNPEPPEATNHASFLDLTTFESWSALLFSVRGWLSIGRFFSREAQAFAPSLVVGIVLAGIIFAAGLKPWFLEFASVFGHATLASDVINAMAGAGLSILLSLSPIGNLPVVHALFKTDALAYPGIVSFCLASVLNLRDIRFYLELFGRKQTYLLTCSLYVAAVLGSLGSTWLYAAVGFRPDLPPIKLASTIFKAILAFVGF